MSNHSPYVELRARSAFSFLEGASAPEELAECAAALGYDAIALGDRDGLYGTPRFHQAATRAGVKAIVGAEVTLEEEGEGLREGQGSLTKPGSASRTKNRYRLRLREAVRDPSTRLALLAGSG